MAPIRRGMTRGNTKNGGEGDGDGKNRDRKSVKRGNSDKVQQRPNSQNNRDKAKTNNGELARNNNSVRQADATSLMKQGDTNTAVRSRKRKRPREDFTHKNHNEPSIEVAMSDTESCIEVAMSDTKSCIEVAMSDTESCIEVAMSDTEPNNQAVFPNMKKRRVGHEPTPKQVQRRQEIASNRRYHNKNSESRSKQDTKNGESDSEMPDTENHQDNLNIGEEQGDFTFSPPTCGAGNSEDEVSSFHKPATKYKGNITALNDMEELLSLSSDTRQVETDRESGDRNTQVVGSNSEVDTDFPRRTTNNEQGISGLQDVQSGGRMDYPSCETETKKKNSATNMHTVRKGGETVTDVQVNMAISETTRNNGQRDSGLDDIESGGNIDSPSCEAESDKQNSNNDIHEMGIDGEVRSDDELQSQGKVRGDGEEDAAFFEGITNDDQRKHGLEETGVSSNKDFSTCEVEASKQNRDSNMQEVGGKGVVDTAFPEGTTKPRESRSKLDDLESGGSMDSHCGEVETGKQNNAPDMHDVRSDGEVRSDPGVDRAFPEETTNNDPGSTGLDNMDSSDSVDYPSSETGTNKQNRDTNKPEVGCDGEIGSDVEMGDDIEAYRAIFRGTTKNGQSNTEVHDMEISGSVESASLKADADRRNSDSDMHE
ncbi:hypothetical protein FOXB_17736, partial [Fusarium oxysporum f. sp. conglutinans Fo5176]